jgi:murein DD-endopeptidase MepM/ murein hydrolase activator NlpD
MYRAEGPGSRVAGRALLRPRARGSALVGLLAGGLLALVPLPSGPTTPAVDLLPYIPISAHQSYGYELALKRFARNPAARQWLGAAEKALLAPNPVELPYRQAGEFIAAADAALGLGFDVAEGRRVRIDIDFLADDPRELFVDVYRVDGAKLERVAGNQASARGRPLDPAPIELDVPAGGRYQLRIQPELATAANYSVSIATAPLLSFPVKGLDTRAIQSGFGAERDGGRRAHRGVDIFAPRGTAAVAATDGWIVRVETTKVGGNVVWMRPLLGDLRLYYAHLDTQLVEPGQFVRAGDPIGTIGNTGNASTTPPHLHFGVYLRRLGMRGGARDPYAFLR